MSLIYVETTVWSFAFADDSPDYTADTLRFFERCRAGDHDLRISGVVIKEIDRSDDSTRAAIRRLISEIAPIEIPLSREAEALADAFLRLGAVPPSKPDDAAHVAAAFIGGCDVLVSWNFKHIANVRRAERFNAIAVLQGFSKRLIIASPAEVQYGEHQA